MNVDLLLTGLLQGLILAMIAYALMIPFRLLNFPDLTSEGAYPFGGAICVSLLGFGLPPSVAMLLGALGGGGMGIATSFIHLRFGVNTLLAGIILSTMAYSVNLHIMGQPNVALFDTASLFNANYIINNLLILLLLLVVCIIPFALFLRTDFGLKLRAVGLNPEFARQQGISIYRYTILGLFLAGCMSGFAGTLMVQLQRYMDVGMGIGILIQGLAGLMIGEALVGINTLNRQLLAPLVGALLYQQIQGLALSFGLAPDDLKFFTASIVLMVIAIKKRHNNVGW